MLPKRFFTCPLFHEYETVGVLGVFVGRVCKAPRLLSRAQYVFLAETENCSDATFLCHDTPKYEDHSIAPTES